MPIDSGDVWNPTPTPVVLPPPPVAAPAPPPASAGGTVASPAASSVGRAPTPEEFQNWILNSPEYKQGLENLTIPYETAISRMDQMAALQNRGGGASWTPITIPQSFYDQIKLAQEKAAHDYANQKALIPEMLAARGMLRSGQLQTDQGEADYDYQTLLKDIDLQKRAREEEVAEANKRGQASVASANAAAANARQIAALQAQWRKDDLAIQLAQDKAQLLSQVQAQYRDWYWDGTKYVGPTVK